MHVDRRTQAVVLHGGRWTQVARGVAGRANVRLCVASTPCPQKRPTVRKGGSTVLAVRVRYIIKAPLVLMGLSN